MKQDEKMSTSKVKIEETDDLLYIIIKNGHQYQSIILQKCEYEETTIQMLRCNYERLKRIRYGTLCITDDGTEVNGWSFEFDDETANFSHYQ